MVEELTLMAVGDTCTGGAKEYAGVVTPTWKGVWKEGIDLYTVFEKVAPVLQQSDFTLGDLEGAVCELLPPIEGKAGTGGYLVRMPPEAADVLKRAGFDALALANNHCMDFGAEGMLQTLASLDRAGIAHFGGGHNIHDARKPAILQQDGVRLALLSYSSVFLPGTFPAGENKPGIVTVAINTSYEIPGNIRYAPGVPPRIITTPNHEDRRKMEEDVQQAKAQADVVVVYWHWGSSKWANSYASGLPMEDSLFFVLNYQEDMGRAAIDAGADLIVGAHPQRLQGVELYKGKLICYSVGHLTKPFREGPNFGEEAVIVKGYVDRKSKQLIRVTLIPVMVPEETVQPYIVPIGEAGGIIAELERLSKKYGTKFRTEGEEITIVS